MEAIKRSVSRGRDGLANTFGNIRQPSTSRDAANGDHRRGRDMISTGRGGVGNIVRSPSRDIEPESLGHINSANIMPKALSSGRGGAGNIRSPSREARVGPEHSQTSGILSDHANIETEYEREVLQRHAEARMEVHSTGRGGLGNIDRSRSRSRSQAPVVHSSGRGGAGNIKHGLGDPEHVDIQDDLERLRHSHAEGLHSTGRGGLANLTHTHGPNIEVAHHNGAQFESTGRGGVGNIRDRSTSREPGSRNSSRDAHPISTIWNKVTHMPHVHTEDPNAIQETPDNEEE